MDPGPMEVGRPPLDATCSADIPAPENAPEDLLSICEADVLCQYETECEDL